MRRPLLRRSNRSPSPVPVSTYVRRRTAAARSSFGKIQCRDHAASRLCQRTELPQVPDAVEDIRAWLDGKPVRQHQNKDRGRLAEPKQFCRNVRAQGFVERRRVEERAGSFRIKRIVRRIRHHVPPHRSKQCIGGASYIPESVTQRFSLMLRRRFRQVPAIRLRTTVKAPEQKMQCPTRTRS